MALRGLGQLPIRVGGVIPGWLFFLGEIADLGERGQAAGSVSLREMRTPEFYDHDFSLPDEYREDVMPSLLSRLFRRRPPGRASDLHGLQPREMRCCHKARSMC